jgi:hypothetical protein
MIKLLADFCHGSTARQIENEMDLPAGRRQHIFGFALFVPVLCALCVSVAKKDDDDEEYDNEHCHPVKRC